RQWPWRAAPARVAAAPSLRDSEIGDRARDAGRLERVPGSVLDPQETSRWPLALERTFASSVHRHPIRGGPPPACLADHVLARSGTGPAILRRDVVCRLRETR